MLSIPAVTPITLTDVCVVAFYNKIMEKLYYRHKMCSSMESVYITFPDRGYPWQNFHCNLKPRLKENTGNE